MKVKLIILVVIAQYQLIKPIKFTESEDTSTNLQKSYRSASSNNILYVSIDCKLLKSHLKRWADDNVNHIDITIDQM